MASSEPESSSGQELAGQIAQLVARQDQLVENFGELVSQHEALAATHGALLADHAELKEAYNTLSKKLAALEEKSADATPGPMNDDLGNLTEFVSNFSKDVTAHLGAHDQVIASLQMAEEHNHHHRGQAVTREQLEEQHRRLHEFVRQVEARLDDLASLPGTMSGLESRVERLSQSSQAWLNELTALTADLSSRLSDQESVAWGLPGSPKLNQT